MSTVPLDLLEKAVRVWGTHAQTLMVMEEMAELQKEILKNINRGKDNVDNIVDEVADVEIMLAQLKYIYKIEDAVTARIPIKLAKVAKRLEGK